MFLLCSNFSFVSTNFSHSLTRNQFCVFFLIPLIISVSPPQVSWENALHEDEKFLANVNCNENRKVDQHWSYVRMILLEREELLRRISAVWQRRIVVFWPRRQVDVMEICRAKANLHAPKMPAAFSMSSSHYICRLVLLMHKNLFLTTHNQ